MYIGSTDQKGLHHLVWEIMDNAIDETLAGYGNEITLTIKADNSIEISDNGRGMPYKMHASGRPTTEIIFTVLHAGGKFSDESGYKVSGGLHGVGSSVVNALSQFLEVTIYRDQGIWRQGLQMEEQKFIRLNELVTPKKQEQLFGLNQTLKSFQRRFFQYDLIKERLREAAFLIKGLKINLIDQRNPQRETFKYDEGIRAYIEFLNKEKNALHETCLIEGNYKSETKKEKSD